MLVVATFGAGAGLGACGALFIFDDSEDAIDPMAGISITYFAALATFGFARVREREGGNWGRRGWRGRLA